MKKVLIFTNLVLMAAVLYLLFFWKHKTAGVAENQCQALHCKEYGADGLTGMVDINTAMQMAAAYRADSGKKYIGSGPAAPTQDALSVWFNLETLKRFIWKIEDTVCKSGCNELNLGIRIYYAKYPDSATMSVTPDLTDVNPQYAYHHTVFMVPTFDEGSGATAKHIDFDPWHMGPDKCKPLSLSSWLQQNQPAKYQQGERQKVMMLLMSTAPGDGEEQNHGGLAPPPEDEGVFPSDGM